METNGDGPVTVVVRHKVTPGREAQFEEWLRGITREMARFEGQQGYNVVRPADSGRPEYLVFFRFDSFQHLKDWEESETRYQWLQRLEPLAIQVPAWERHTGMEVWFTPQLGRAQPPRWKMLVVTLLAVYPLITMVQFIVVPQLPDMPAMIRTLLTSMLLVSLMTFLVMPLMTRIFSRWLYGQG